MQVSGGFRGGRRAASEGMRPEAIIDLAPWLLVERSPERARARRSYWDSEFAGAPGGGVHELAGGLLYGIDRTSLATVLYARIKKLPVWSMADILAPSIALGHAFGRVGCLMTGCCYGYPTQLPWAITSHRTIGHGARASIRRKSMSRR